MLMRCLNEANSRMANQYNLGEVLDFSAKPAIYCTRNSPGTANKGIVAGEGLNEK